MAYVHGIAGEWARVRGTARGLLPLFVSIGALGFSLGIFCFASALIGVVAVVLSATAVYWTLTMGERRMESYFKGARGEERIAGILRSLPETYHVFNDFVAEKEHVDHVVVGPTGVFAVETKFWRGNVTLDDDHILLDGRLPDHSPLDQVRRSAQAVKNVLVKTGRNESVVPVLVFASNTFADATAESRGVIILNGNQLNKSFLSERVVISPTELERLVHLMESSL